MVESGSFIGAAERLDLSTVVDQALQLLDARMRDEQVSLVLHLTRPAWVRGDAIRLEQVLINLLRNAADASLTPPDEWLSEMATLLQRSRAIRIGASMGAQCKS